MTPTSSAREIRDAIASGATSAVDVCRSALERIDLVRSRSIGSAHPVRRLVPSPAFPSR
jgi:hypothetical protein